MRNIVFVLFFIFSGIIVNAQTSGDTLKAKLSKEWIIQGYEQFSVTEEPEEEKKNDKIIFKADKTCNIVENGKSYAGTWLIDKTKTYISCTLSNGAVKRNYKIISVGDKESIIEYQTPDLIRTKYHMASK
jgi:hypothetical protein